MTFDFAIVGGGILGMATARQLSLLRSGASILLLEKEDGWAQHQTGRNSGVIHSGIYYRPGSLKARMAVEGNRTMVAFCREQGIAHDVCGKLVVATQEREVAGLQKLRDNALANGVAVEWLDGEGAKRFEPHVTAVAALHVPSTGVVDYRNVVDALAKLLAADADLRTGCRVSTIRDEGSNMLLVTTAGEFRAQTVINCAGLFSDRIARGAGARPGIRIVPFRGEYFSVEGTSAGLVRTLIYPVPDPTFPFLGIHLTRGIDGSVHAGPNAVLAFRREGYTWTAFSARDMIDTLSYPGFWRLAARHWDEGLREVLRSWSVDRFAASVQRLVPDVVAADLHRAPAGVRAQALTPLGTLADDFVIVNGRRTIHVCNAPSPAATASLTIGRHLAEAALAMVHL
jgi:L-2-hydroxyglutarate oxidase